MECDIKDACRKIWKHNERVSKGDWKKCTRPHLITKFDFVRSLFFSIFFSVKRSHRKICRFVNFKLKAKSFFYFIRFTIHSEWRKHDGMDGRKSRATPAYITSCYGIYIELQKKGQISFISRLKERKMPTISIIRWRVATVAKLVMVRWRWRFWSRERERNVQKELLERNSLNCYSR